VTATIDSIPLILGSILSKKLAMGAAAVAFDVKTGDGAFIQDLAPTMELARGLASISRTLGTAASCLVTDMSQPMGRWIGHAAELCEGLDALEGKGAPDLMEVTFGLVQEMGRLIGRPLTKEQLERAIASGAARERFDQWAERQGGDPEWLANPHLTLAPEAKPLRAERTGVVARVETRRLDLPLVEGGVRKQAGDQVDLGVAIQVLELTGRPCSTNLGFLLYVIVDDLTATV
jgi:thymidine phosphorylase